MLQPVLGSNTRAFNAVLERAQKLLRKTFAMELVELPSRNYREDDAMAGGEDGRNATGVKKKGRCPFHIDCLGNGLMRCVLVFPFCVLDTMCKSGSSLACISTLLPLLYCVLIIQLLYSCRSWIKDVHLTLRSRSHHNRPSSPYRRRSPSGRNS